MSGKRKESDSQLDTLQVQDAIPEASAPDDGVIQRLYDGITASLSVDFFNGLRERETQDWLCEKDALVREALRVRGKLSPCEIDEIVGPASPRLRRKLIKRVRLGGTVSSFKKGTLYHRDYGAV